MRAPTGRRTGPRHLCHARQARAARSRRSASRWRSEARCSRHSLHTDARRYVQGSVFSRRDLPRAAPHATSVARGHGLAGHPRDRRRGGAHPLTSKVAVIGRPQRDDADVDYLFLQVSSTGRRSATRRTAATSGRRGPVGDGERSGAHQRRHAGSHSHGEHGERRGGACADAGGAVEYEGDSRIDGVPGRPAPIVIEFLDVAGSRCGALLPTGRARPRRRESRSPASTTACRWFMRAEDLGIAAPSRPRSSRAIRARRVERIRLAIGPRMKLGDVAKKTVPKMCLIPPPRRAINTRTFIPHRVHEAIGVLAR